MKKPEVLERQCAEMKAKRQAIVAKPPGGADRADELALAVQDPAHSYLRCSPEPGDQSAEIRALLTDYDSVVR